MIQRVAKISLCLLVVLVSSCQQQFPEEPSQVAFKCYCDRSNETNVEENLTEKILRIKNQGSAIEQFDWTSGSNSQSYDIYCNVLNGSIINNWVLQLPFQDITHGTFHMIEPSNLDTLRTAKIGMFERAKKQDGYLSIGPKHILMDLILSTDEERIFLFNIRNEKGGLKPIFNIEFVPKNRRYDRNRNSILILFTAFSSILLLLSFMSIIIGFITKDRSFYFYSLFLFLLCIWITFSYGLLRNWLINLDVLPDPKYVFLLRTTVDLLAATYLLFISSFSQLKKYNNGLVRIIHANAIFCAVLFIVDLILLLSTNFNFIYSNLIGATSNFMSILIGIYIAFKIWKHRDDYLIKITLAGLITIAIILLISLVKLVFNEFKSIDSYETLIGQSIEITLFNIGLGIKLKEYILVNNENKLVKKLLSEKELLLKEVHHRVKNNLQVISSLLALQSRSIDDLKAKQAIEEGRNRVQSMSLIHKQLYQKDDLSGVDMSIYLTDLSKHLFQTYNIHGENIQFSSTIDTLVLDVDTVIPIGLITNELITNSLKYAFPNNAKGKIHLSLKEKNNCLELTVEDDGIGIGTKELKNQHNSFGHTMISAFKDKLKANIKVDNKDGTRIDLTISNYIRLN